MFKRPFVLVFSLFMIFPSLSFAISRADNAGSVVYKEVVYGSTGSVNRINLTLDTYDGLFWTVYCSRAETNLGYCSAVEVGSFIFVYGNIESISPLRMNVKSMSEISKP